MFGMDVQTLSPPNPVSFKNHASERTISTTNLQSWTSTILSILVLSGQEEENGWHSPIFKRSVLNLFQINIHVYWLLLLLFSCKVVSDYFRSHGLNLDRLLCLWNFSGKNTGVYRGVPPWLNLRLLSKGTHQYEEAKLYNLLNNHPVLFSELCSSIGTNAF